MLDLFDLTLLEAAQCDGSQTANDLATQVPLSPSAIARRLRSDGWIIRTIALLSPRLLEYRLRAVVLLQVGEHSDREGMAALRKRILDAPQIQSCYELAGTYDLFLLFNCASMSEFNDPAENVLAADATAPVRNELHQTRDQVRAVR